jgi:hypothetical protein
MNSGERCVDAQKAAFLNQVIRKEALAQRASPVVARSSPAKGAGNPIAPAFTFQQTYSLSSGNPVSQDASIRRKQQIGSSNGVPSTSREHLSSSSVFSSYDFGSQPSRAASSMYGHFYDTGQAAHLPLRIQKQYGGAAMAGLTMAREGGKPRRATERVADAAKRSFRVSKEGGAAFPALARSDPHLMQLLEDEDTLNSRKASLMAQHAALTKQIEDSQSQIATLDRH